MKRRHFVGATGAALATALWPAFLRESFADEPGEPATAPACDASPLARVAVVAASFRRARAAGRALLVLVVPEDGQAKWRRGQTFGELLNFGADRDLAPLAFAEVVCATMEDLRKVVPTAGSGEPLLVLVRADKVPASARQLDLTLPEVPRFQEGTWQEHEKIEDAMSDQHIAALGALLRRELGTDDKHEASLAAEVRARLQKQRVPGAKWARSQGCGVDVEGEPPMMVGCGMGSVPKKAQRFLYFFTDRRF